jgi:hypothetical protein
VSGILSDSAKGERCDPFHAAGCCAASPSSHPGPSPSLGVLVVLPSDSHLCVALGSVVLHLFLVPNLLLRPIAFSLVKITHNVADHSWQLG